MGLFAGTPFDRPPHCERCDKLDAECTCSPQAAARRPTNKQTATLAVEKRKKSKVVTVIRGLAAADNDLPTLLTQLKNSCGAGGSLQDGELEIQGEHLDRLRDVLGKLGYRVKG